MFGYLWPLLVPLAFLVGFLLRGTRPTTRPGTDKQYVFTNTKGRGAPTLATFITAVSSSSYQRGPLSADWYGPIWLLPESSYGGHGWSTGAMAHGPSGARDAPAGSS